MSAVGDFLFGSDDSVSQQGANIVPLGKISGYENQLENTVLPGALSSYSQGQNLLSSLSSGQLPSAFQTAYKQSISDAVGDTLGSGISSLAKRGVVNSSALDTLAENIADSVASSAASNYNNSFSNLSNLASNLTSPAYSLQNLYTSGRLGLSEPAQTVVSSGSSGLLGGLASGGAFNSLIGKLWS